MRDNASFTRTVRAAALSAALCGIVLSAAPLEAAAPAKAAPQLTDLEVPLTRAIEQIVEKIYVPYLTAEMPTLEKLNSIVVPLGCITQVDEAYGGILITDRKNAPCVKEKGIVRFAVKGAGVMSMVLLELDKKRFSEVDRAITSEETVDLPEGRIMKVGDYFFVTVPVKNDPHVAGLLEIHNRYDRPFVSYVRSQKAEAAEREAQAKSKP